jgi:TolA-binding protein
MSSNCQEFNELLLDLAYDELDEETSQRLHQHKDSCEDCKSAFEALMGVRTVAQQMVPPPIPDHFDAAILELARKKASALSAANDTLSVADPAGTSPVARPASLFERLQGFIFRPMVLGTGLAAAAAVFAVVSLKTQSHNTMLEPMNGTPFVGAVPMEKEALPDEQTAPASPTNQGMEADAADVTATSREKLPSLKGAVPSRNRVQKAGPGYAPLYNATDRTAPKSRDVASSAPRASSPETTPGANIENIRKNPADMLKRTPDAPAADQKMEAKRKAAPAGSSKPETTRSSKTRKKSVSIAQKSRTMDDLDGLAEPVSASGAMPRSSDEALEDADMAEESSGTPAPATSEFEAGLSAYRSGNCQAAIGHFRVLLDDANGSGNQLAVATHYMASCEKRTGRCGQAVIHFEHLFTAYPRYSNRSEALFEAANCHMKLGHNDRAKALLEELSMDPEWRNKAEKLLKKM